MVQTPTPVMSTAPVRPPFMVGQPVPTTTVPNASQGAGEAAFGTFAREHMTGAPSALGLGSGGSVPGRSPTEKLFAPPSLGDFLKRFFAGFQTPGPKRGEQRQPPVRQAPLELTVRKPVGKMPKPRTIGAALSSAFDPRTLPSSSGPKTFVPAPMPKSNPSNPTYQYNPKTGGYGYY